MPSLLDTLPADIRFKVWNCDPALRDDLKVIASAEAAGWTASWGKDHWHNPAGFRRGNVHVWLTTQDWRRSAVVDGHFSRTREVFPGTLDGARAALGLD